MKFPLSSSSNTIQNLLEEDALSPDKTLIRFGFVIEGSKETGGREIDGTKK